LTPAGLEHLMETQDKLACTATVNKETDVFTDLEVLSKKASENN